MKQDKLLGLIEQELDNRYTPETVCSYMYAIKRFLDKHPNAHRLKLSDIESYFKGLKQSKYSVGYRTALLSAVKALYDCYIEFGMTKEHPCKSYQISEKKPSGKNFSALLTLEELELLLKLKEERYKYVGNRNKAMIGLLIYQGLTSKELIHLDVNSIDWELGTIRIIGQGKNKGRVLQLKPNQIPVLMRYIENDRPQLLKSNTNKLFIGMRGDAMTTDALHEFIARLGGAFDKEVSPKNIRNSVINYWLNDRKMRLEDVQIMAGHTYPSTTEKYYNPNSQEQREAINRLHNNIFGRSGIIAG